MKSVVAGVENSAAASIANILDASLGGLNLDHNLSAAQRTGS